VISLQNINSKALARQSGVSLIELLIAMTLGLFLTFALVEILINGKQSFGSANHLSRIQENGRIATNLMVTDLKRAGYLGGNSNVQDIFGSSGQFTPTAISCNATNTNWGRMISQPLAGLDDDNAGYACIPDADYLRGDILTVRHAMPWIEGGALTANRLYLRSSLFQGKVFVGSAKDQAANKIDDPQGQLNVRELQAHSFFIGNSGRSCGGNAIPSLFRVSLDTDGLPDVEELLPGVSNLQVQYGVSSVDGAGVENGRYLNADEVVDWDNVVTVRIWLLVRAECSETGYLDSATYTMGDQVVTPADNFRRQLYSSVVMIRN
jgi:type IV pilus assembly protein PilW